MSLPELPESPTADQLSAWDELASLLSDPSFENEIRESARAFWTDALDAIAYKVASTKAYEDAVRAIVDGLLPQSAPVQAIARD